MGMIARMIAPGLTITLHPGLPGGSVTLARSARVGANVFADTGRRAVNLGRIDCEGVAHGNARYVGLWVEGVLEGTGELAARQLVSPGLRLYFPRGGLELRR